MVFAKDKNRVSAFYQATLGLVAEASDTSHDLLHESGCEGGGAQPPARVRGEHRRYRSTGAARRHAVQATSVVASLAAVRRAAEATGGFLKREAGAWHIRGHTVIDGWDPEGNVVQFKQADSPS